LLPIVFIFSHYYSVIFSFSQKYFFFFYYWSLISFKGTGAGVAALAILELSLFA